MLDIGTNPTKVVGILQEKCLMTDIFTTCRRVESEHSETAGSLLGFAMSVGLAAGAGFSFVIKLIL